MVIEQNEIFWKQAEKQQLNSSEEYDQMREYDQMHTIYLKENVVKNIKTREDKTRR